MTAVQVVPFQFGQQTIRTVTVDGVLWFVAADVAGALGYSTTAAMTRSLDDDEKGVQNLHTPGGEQAMSVVTEAGAYTLAMRSQIEQAKKFRRWLAHDVVPSINRTGSYSVQPQFDVPKTYAAALRLAADETERAEKAERQIAADAPKVEAFDNLMDADGYYDFLSAGKILGVGRTTLFRRLREIGVLIPKTRMPYERYAHHFKVTVSTWTDPDGFVHTTETTRIRPSALPFLAKKLDASGEQLRVITGGAS